MPKLSSPIVVVLSGGLDSTVLLAHALSTRSNADVYALSFAYGSKHNERELVSAHNVAVHYAVRHDTMTLEPVFAHFKSDLLLGGGEVPEGHYAASNMAKTVVPFRNGIMLSCAAGYAESLGAASVAIGSHAGDHHVYPDCRPMFNLNMAAAVRMGTSAGIEVQRPFEQMTKAEIVRLGDRLKAPLVATWSCYKGGQEHCGRCATCVERCEAFDLAGVGDPTQYLDTTFWRDAVEAHENGRALRRA